MTSNEIQDAYRCGIAELAGETTIAERTATGLEGTSRVTGALWSTLEVWVDPTEYQRNSFSTADHRNKDTAYGMAGGLPEETQIVRPAASDSHPA